MRSRENATSFAMTALTLAILAVSGALWPLHAQAEPEAALEGWLTVLWGDDEAGASVGPFYQLTDSAGQSLDLQVEESAAQPEGGVLSLNGRYVRIQGYWPARAGGSTGPAVFSVTAIAPAQPPESKALEGDLLPAVSGSRPWVSIMCKLSDFADEPKNLSYFQGMYASTQPGLDHYWREQSYETANVAGSGAAGWFALPQPKLYYNPTNTQGGANLDLLRSDCIAAANASVNFALYSGINMMFNTDFDNGYAWGGSRYLTLDGVSKVWSITWEPPWGYADITVIAHEMGHGFGLPHSSGNYGQTYDNQWDVMSDSWSNCSRSDDPTYGCLGQHTISYHKDILGWIAAGQSVVVGQNTQATLTMEQTALPATGNPRMVRIPIAGSPSRFYTVEARRQTGYDYKLPGQGVIIHDVDTTRSRPAYVVDSDGNGNTGDAGAMWVAGETFQDIANKIQVRVLAATATGFRVNIRSGDLILADVDASGAADLRDAILVFQVMTGATPAATVSLNADVDADGKLGLSEAVYAMQKVAGLR